MSELVPKANLKLWLKGDGFRIKGASSLWGDSSGVVAALTPGLTPAGAPALVFPSSGLPPYINFDGAADDYASASVPLSTYFAGGGSTVFFAINADTASGTGASAQADNAIIGAANTQSPIVSVATLAGVPSLVADITDSGGRKTVSTAVGFALDTWLVGWFGWDGTKVYIGTDPIIYATTAAGSQIGGAPLSATIQVAKGVTGPNFFDGFIGEILVYKAFLAEDDRCSVFNYLAARWEERGDTLEIMRDVASRVAWERGVPRMHIVAKKIPLSTPLQANPFNDIREAFFSHPLGIHPTGQGWRETNVWEPRPGRVEELTVDFDADEDELRAYDLRPFRHSLVESGIATAAGPRRDGGLVTTGGAIRVFSCDNITNYISPVDGISVLQALPDEQKAIASGLSLHVAQNFLARSCFVSGVTGLGATVGTGVNGSAIALDATDSVFGTETQPTPQSLKFTAGTPHTTDLYQPWPVTGSIGGLGNPRDGYLSLMWNGSGSLAIRLQRSIDSKYLADATTGTWTASATWVTIPAPGGSGLYPSRVSVIPLGPVAAATATTFTLQAGLPSGGTSGRTSNLYWAQLSSHSAPAVNGVIRVTDATADTGITGAEDYFYSYLLNSMGVGGPIDAQTIAFKLKLAHAYQLDGTKNYLLRCLVDASVSLTAGDGWGLSLENSGLAWVAHAGGADYKATVPFTPALGSTYRIVVRRISSHGDLGIAPYTLSIFLDGVKGTDALEVNHPADCPALVLAAYAGTGPTSHGAISNFVASPYALTDEECIAWGR